MPPSRRHPRPTPTRRPRVAGSRNPSANRESPSKRSAESESTPVEANRGGEVFDAEEPTSVSGTGGSETDAADGAEADAGQAEVARSRGRRTGFADPTMASGGMADPTMSSVRTTRPSPRPKAKERDTGTHKPTDTEAAEQASTAGGRHGARRNKTQRAVPREAEPPAGGAQDREAAETVGAERERTPYAASGTADAGGRDEYVNVSGYGATGETESTAQPAAGRRDKKKYILATALTVVALLLIGLAIFFKTQGSEVESSTGNEALINPARTAEVKEAATKAVESLFSYDFNDLGKTENAANDLLVNPDVKGKYDKEIAEVKRLAPEQKMISTAKVSRSAVILLDGDRAKVLTFIDLTSTRTDQNKTTAGGSQLSLNMQKQGDNWKVTDMDAYTDGLPQGQPGQQPPPGK